MFTDRNVFNLIYKCHFSHTTSTNTSVLQRKPFAFVMYEKQHGFLRTSLCTKQNAEGNCPELLFTHTTYAVMADIETYLPRGWALFTTVYLRNGPTVDLIKRFHSFTNTSIDDGCCNFSRYPALVSFSRHWEPT